MTKFLNGLQASSTSYATDTYQRRLYLLAESRVIQQCAHLIRLMLHARKCCMAGPKNRHRAHFQLYCIPRHAQSSIGSSWQTWVWVKALDLQIRSHQTACAFAPQHLELWHRAETVGTHLLFYEQSQFFEHLHHNEWLPKRSQACCCPAALEACMRRNHCYWWWAWQWGYWLCEQNLPKLELGALAVKETRHAASQQLWKTAYEEIIIHNDVDDDAIAWQFCQWLCR